MFAENPLTIVVQVLLAAVRILTTAAPIVYVTQVYCSNKQARSRYLVTRKEKFSPDVELTFDSRPPLHLLAMNASTWYANFKPLRDARKYNSLLATYNIPGAYIFGTLSSIQVKVLVACDMPLASSSDNLKHRTVVCVAEFGPCHTWYLLLSYFV